MTKINLRRTLGLVQLTTLGSHSLLREVKAGTQGKKPDVDGAHGGVLLTGLLLMTHLACLLIQPNTTSSGVAPPTVR